MISRNEVIQWLQTLEGDVAIDDDGLTLVEVDKNNQPAESYMGWAAFQLNNKTI